MSAKANHFKLGLFMLGGTSLLIMALVLLGLGDSLKRPLMVETYLDQSVQGLEIGSKVNFRGVLFGSVSGIGFSRTRYEEGKPVEEQRRYILIEVAVEPRFHGEWGHEFFNFLKAEILRGLRFRLNSQGITGLSYLELDYVDPARYPRLPMTWTPEHLYIPSAPGTLTKLLTSVEQVFRRLEGVDLEQVLTNLNRLLATAENEIRSAQIASISSQATNLLSELRDSNQALQAVLKDPKLKEIPAQTLHLASEVLARSLASDGVLGEEQRTFDGVAFAAGMLNAMPAETTTRLLDDVSQRSEPAAKKIREAMFTFEDLGRLTSRAIAPLMREVQPDQLVIALKTASEDLRLVFFGAISSRAAASMMDDLSMMPPMRLSDVEIAQRAVVAVAMRLAAEGKLVLPTNGKEELV